MVRSHRPPEWPDWFEPKRYPHFDEPIRTPEQVRPLIESPEYVARHAFHPFIHFHKKARKYKRELGRFVEKPRPLSYASHTDSLIFRRYRIILSHAYESVLTARGFSDSVLAYRSFKEKRCNIDFANRAFCWIRQNVPCVAMAFDLKDFFETIDHNILKRQWKAVLSTNSLPEDHYSVFRAVTKYAWVDRDELYLRLGLRKTKLREWYAPLCTPYEFRTLVRTQDPSRNLIKVKSDGKGIPQGSPISSLLSNIYMLDFDQYMYDTLHSIGGLYCRYSDDILIVSPPDKRKTAERALLESAARSRLELHEGPGKKTVAEFRQLYSNKVRSDRPLQYLGFTFDGDVARIRSHTISRFLRRMRKSVRREKFLARMRAKAGGRLLVRRKRLYRDYSHLGTRNFLSGYARRAARRLSGNVIRRQVKGYWAYLHELLEDDEERKEPPEGQTQGSDAPENASP